MSSHRKQTEVSYYNHTVGKSSPEMVLSVSLQNKNAAVSFLACRQWHMFNVDFKSIFQGSFRLHQPYHWVTLVASSEFTTRHLVNLPVSGWPEMQVHSSKGWETWCLAGAQSWDLMPRAYCVGLGFWASSRRGQAALWPWGGSAVRECSGTSKMCQHPLATMN